MVTLTIELVSFISAKLFQDNALSYSKNFWPEQQSFEGQWEDLILGLSHPSSNQTVTERKIMFLVGIVKPDSVLVARTHYRI